MIERMWLRSWVVAMLCATVAGCASGPSAPVESRTGTRSPGPAVPVNSGASAERSEVVVRPFPGAGDSGSTVRAYPGSVPTPRSGGSGAGAPDSANESVVRQPTGADKQSEPRVAMAPPTTTPSVRHQSAAGTRAGSAVVSSNRAVVSLAREAEGQQSRGELARAAASLERALRIENRNASLWHRLAVVRCEQKRFAECESLARRSRSLRGGHDLKAANDRLISRARGGTITR